MMPLALAAAVRPYASAWARYPVARAQVTWALRHRGLKEILDGLAEGTRAPAEPKGLDAQAINRIERGTRVLDGVLARVPGLPNTCLYRSLARYAVLRRQGVPAAFVMGVKAGEDLEGHAWIEIDGQALDGTAPHAFARTLVHPSPIPIRGAARCD